MVLILDGYFKQCIGRLNVPKLIDQLGHNQPVRYFT